MRTLIATAIAFLAMTGTALADTDVTGGPNGTTTDATPTFTFRGEPGSTFECKVDPVTDWKPCASPFSVKLADGTYTFSVRATDEAGNVETNPPSRGPSTICVSGASASTVNARSAGVESSLPSTPFARTLST